MSSSVLAKIRALVARAASDQEEEARTSAVLACRQMLEHKIVLTLPGAPPEDKTDEELRAAVWEYVERRQRQASAYNPSHASRASHNRYSGAQARARAYARATSYAQSTEIPEPGPTHRHHVSPFDPYEASFEQVRDFVKARGIDVHDNGGGNFSAHMGQSWCKGSWNQIVRFMFSLLETGRADVFWRDGSEE